MGLFHYMQRHMQRVEDGEEQEMEEVEIKRGNTFETQGKDSSSIAAKDAKVSEIKEKGSGKKRRLKRNKKKITLLLILMIIQLYSKVGNRFNIFGYAVKEVSSFTGQ